jgi:hypothetical protein
MAVVVVLTGLEAAWPYLDWLPIPRGMYALCAALISSGAIYARFVFQKPISGGNDADQ